MLQVCTGDLGPGWGGDGVGNSVLGRDWQLKIYILVSLREHFGSLWVDLGGSWIDSGLKLGATGPHWSIGSHFWCLRAALWVGFGAP